jgi:hypothetical protein
MRVVFLLPRFSRRPIGGFRVVYEYARRLGARGHTVTVVHPRALDPHDAGRGCKKWLWPAVRYAQCHVGFWFPPQASA